MKRTQRAGAVVALTVCAVAAVSTPALAGDDSRHGNREPIKVVASGLNGPRELADGPGDRWS